MTVTVLVEVGLRGVYRPCDIIIVVALESIVVLEGIAAEKILDKEVRELIQFVVRTEGVGVVALVPGKVVLQGVDVLVQTVGHGGTLDAQVDGTAADIVDGNARIFAVDVTFVPHAYIAGTRLVGHRRRETALQLGDELVGHALERIGIAAAVEGFARTGVVQLGRTDDAPAQGGLVGLVDVPVQFQSTLVAPCVNILGRESRGIVHSLTLCKVGNLRKYIAGLGGIDSR